MYRLSEHRELDDQFTPTHRHGLDLATHHRLLFPRLPQHVYRPGAQQLARRLLCEPSNLARVLRGETIDVQFLELGVFQVGRAALRLEPQMSLHQGAAGQRQLLHDVACDIEAQPDAVTALAQYHLRMSELALIKRIGVRDRKQALDLLLQLRLIQLHDEVHRQCRHRQHTRPKPPTARSAGNFTSAAPSASIAAVMGGEGRSAVSPLYSTPRYAIMPRPVPADSSMPTILGCLGSLTSTLTRPMSPSP